MIELFHSFDWDKLPEDLKKVIDKPRYDYEFFSWLVIRWPNGEIEVQTDKMEPEDASFGRDLKWIIPALQKMYAAGQSNKIRA